MTVQMSEKEWQDLRDESRQALPEALDGLKDGDGDDLPSVLLSYQAELLTTTAMYQLVVCEKSRRIGMTWAVAADAVLSAGLGRTEGGMDVLYIGYNLDMAREFIDTCAMWARAFISAASDVEEYLFKDQHKDGETKDINAFRIRFASGHEIVALTSNPRSLRGRQGYVIFDEAAFHDALEELLKAAMALLMWGGKVLVISTHDGADNPFNELIQEVRSGKREGKVVKVTFNEAVEAGLYERIALVTGKPDTAEAKQKWISSIFGSYGDDADEELHVIPKAGTGTYMSGAAIDACMTDANEVVSYKCKDGFELLPIEEREKRVKEFLDEKIAPVLARLDPERNTALGEDFGRSSDLTILSIAQELKDMSIDVPLMIELKNMPIAQQFQIIKFVIENVPRFVGAKFDATGNGLGLAEQCQEEFGHDRIEAIKITQTFYLENAPKLKQHVEDRTIQLPRDSDVKNDCRVVRLVNGVPSIPKTRKDGRHGDAWVSLVMAVNALDMEVEIYEFDRVAGAGSRYEAVNDDDDDDFSDNGQFARGGAW